MFIHRFYCLLRGQHTHETITRCFMVPLCSDHWINSHGVPGYCVFFHPKVFQKICVCLGWSDERSWTSRTDADGADEESLRWKAAEPNTRSIGRSLSFVKHRDHLQVSFNTVISIQKLGRNILIFWHKKNIYPLNETRSDHHSWQLTLHKNFSCFFPNSTENCLRHHREYSNHPPYPLKMFFWYRSCVSTRM